MDLSNKLGRRCWYNVDMNWAANNNMSLSAYPVPVTANQSFGEAGVRSAASLDDFCDKKDRSIVFFMNTYKVFFILWIPK